MNILNRFDWKDLKNDVGYKTKTNTDMTTWRDCEDFLRAEVGERGLKWWVGIGMGLYYFQDFTYRHLYFQCLPYSCVLVWQVFEVVHVDRAFKDIPVHKPYLNMYVCIA